MRYLKRPHPIEIVIGKESKGEVEFATWLEGWPLNDARVFGNGFDALKSARRILRVTAEANGVIGYEEADWERLCKAVLSPSQPWQPIIARQYVEFMEAILDAKEEPPQ
jgi:hypothetical protein